MEPRAEIYPDGEPTPSRREMLNGSLVSADIYAPNSRVPVAIRWKVSTPILKMKDDGCITEDHVRAADLFQRDYNVGIVQTSMMAGRYGVDFAMASIGSGGTPVSQQLPRIGQDGRPLNAEEDEETRIFHAKRYSDACRYIGHRATVFWMTAVICEIPLGNAVKPPTLTDIGKTYMGCACPKQQAMAGKTLIKSGLERLIDYPPYAPRGDRR